MAIQLRVSEKFASNPLFKSSFNNNIVMDNRKEKTDYICTRNSTQEIGVLVKIMRTLVCMNMSVWVWVWQMDNTKTSNYNFEIHFPYQYTFDHSTSSAMVQFDRD